MTQPIANPKATIETDEYGYVVDFEWEGVDRPRTYSIATGTNRRLAERLAAAAEAGAVFYDAHIATDIAGQTYVAANSRVFGRHLNADLKRLGY